MAEIFTDGTAVGRCVPVGQRRCLHVHRLRARSEAFNDVVRKLHAGSKVLPSTPACLPVWSPKRVNSDTEWISPPHLDHGQPRTNTCSPATTKTTVHSVSARSRGVGLWASQAVAEFSRIETYGFLRYWERRGVEHTTTALCPRGRSQMSGRKLLWPGLGLGGGRRQHPGLRVQRGCCRSVRLPLTLGEGDGT
jgi:hypothetical protein